ncbi:MAG: hydroxymethylbilane synthase [Thermoanaerobacteraceae bacterium]|nr:hydroxymethylbilane synthase [Thermoanaerobacteraceae bacterium]
MGTRRSELALTQTAIVINEMKKHRPDMEFEVKKITTQGDKLLQAPLSQIGGKGLFVKELEEALLEGSIDMAVHSMKDMPYEIPEKLCVMPVLKREEARDVLISREGNKFMDLKAGAKIGTSSLRRISQLKALRPDIEIVQLRGNIQTRIRKISDENLDGIVLAAAGLKRLGLEEKITQYFPVDLIVPAACQGTLAVEIREGFEEEFMSMYPMLLDVKTLFETIAERKILKRLGGNCKIPIGIYAQYIKEDNIDKIKIKVAFQKNTELMKVEEKGIVDDIDKMADTIMEKLGEKDN